MSTRIIWTFRPYELMPSATIIILAFGEDKIEKILANAALLNQVITRNDGEEFTTPGGICLALYFADTGSKESSLAMEKDESCTYNYTDNWMMPEKNVENCRPLGCGYRVSMLRRCGIFSFLYALTAKSLGRSRCGQENPVI